jgi:glycosyltransferase involved in cell wall biosynthesis
MKLVVMIPAYNEESTISSVIKEIPHSIDGISSIDILVIDDGSFDKTRAFAMKAGATKVVSHKTNRGLAAAFRTGLHVALKMNADIIVNTDADFQYDQSQIPDLIHPILLGEADLVLGSRFKGYIEEMPFQKVLGNLTATLLTRLLSGFNTSDAQTGFRALSRNLASSLKITSKKTYVQETIIRSAVKGFRIVEIPAIFRKREGESRLIKSIWRYALAVFPDMIRCYIDSKMC